MKKNKALRIIALVTLSCIVPGLAGWLLAAANGYVWGTPQFGEVFGMTWITGWVLMFLLSIPAFLD